MSRFFIGYWLTKQALTVGGGGGGGGLDGKVCTAVHTPVSMYVFTIRSPLKSMNGSTLL